MKEKYNAKLLVEGINDKHVIYALAEKYHLVENFDVIDCGSIENVYRQMELRLSNPTDLMALGIIVDADSDACVRFHKFVNLLPLDGYDTDGISFSEVGTIIEPNDTSFPIVGVWVMPNNQSEGMIEDFMMALTSDGDKQLLGKADVVLDEIKAKGLQRFKDVHRSKAKIHTYLAWQEQPGLPLGVSIKAKAFDADATLAHEIVDWLKLLFS